jgi:hypothetical protein
MTLYLAPIVEGQTEERSVGRLLQRIWTELLGSSERLQVLQPSRGKRDAMISQKKPDLGHKIGQASIKLAHQLRRAPDGRGFLLLLLDAEGDCPKVLAPRLLRAAQKAGGNANIACVLAKRMLENWIVAGATTLAGVNGLPDSLPARDQFEKRSGAAWLEAQLRRKHPNRKYKKTVDAEQFVRRMNLEECRENCPSFDKLCRELEEWIVPASSKKASNKPLRGR